MGQNVPLLSSENFPFGDLM